MGETSFVDLAKQSDAVIRGTVTQYHWEDQNKNRPPLAMTLNIQEVYQGDVTAQELKVWGDNGIQCRPYVTQFPIGTEWVFALSPDLWTKGGDYAISICGEYWLAVNDSQVEGKVTVGGPDANPETLSLSEFRQQMNSAPKPIPEPKPQGCFKGF